MNKATKAHTRTTTRYAVTPKRSLNDSDHKRWRDHNARQAAGAIRRWTAAAARFEAAVKPLLDSQGTYLHIDLARALGLTSDELMYQVARLRKHKLWPHKTRRVATPHSGVRRTPVRVVCPTIDHRTPKRQQEIASTARDRIFGGFFPRVPCDPIGARGDAHLPQRWQAQALRVAVRRYRREWRRGINFLAPKSEAA